MGYFIKPIVKDNKELMPTKVSLANNSNYMQLESREKTGKRKAGITLTSTFDNPCQWIVSIEEGYEIIDSYFANLSAFAIRDNTTGIEYPFKGRFSEGAISNLKWLVGIEAEDLNTDLEGFNIFEITDIQISYDYIYILENLKKCILSIDYFRENMTVLIIGGNLPYREHSLEIIPKRPYERVDFELVVYDIDYMEMKDIIIDYDQRFSVVSFQIMNSDISPDKTKISIIESERRINHFFQGTNDEKKVDKNTFLLSKDTAETAENIRSCLMKDSFFRSNFDISIPPIAKEETIVPGNLIRIVPRRESVNCNFSFITPLDKTFIKHTGDPSNLLNRDALGGEKSFCEIELDIYRDTGVFLGEEDNTAVGTYITTLSKLYFSKPLWFDINTVAGNEVKYATDFLHATGWCNAGTVSDYRFIAKRFDGANREPFYISDILYAVNGYDRSLELNDLDSYVYKAGECCIIKPLSKQPRTTHIKGQSQYFNFILSNSQTKSMDGADSRLGIFYRLYTQSGKFVAEKEAHTQDLSLFSIVNTIALDIGGFYFFIFLYFGPSNPITLVFNHSQTA